MNKPRGSIIIPFYNERESLNELVRQINQSLSIKEIKFEAKKKEILSSEINLIRIQKRINNYRALRRKEFMLRNKLRSSISSFTAKINLIQSTFPEEFKISSS